MRSLLAAELWRAGRLRSARLVALAGPLVAALGVALSVPADPGAGSTGLALLDGWRGAIAFLATVLAAVWSGGWQSTGTGAEVLRWFGRRVPLVLTAIVALGTAATVCALSTWTGALVGLLVGGNAGAYGETPAMAELLGASGQVAVAAAGGALIGAGIGMAIASPVGALGVLGGLLVLVEPILYTVRAELGAQFGLVMPIDALMGLAGSAAAGGSVRSLASSTATSLPAPWVVALVWGIGATGLAAMTFARREL